MIRYAQLCPTSQPTHNQHCTRRRAIRTARAEAGKQQDAGRGTSQAATADAPIRRAPGGGCARRARGQRDHMKNHVEALARDGFGEDAVYGRLLRIWRSQG